MSGAPKLERGFTLLSFMKRAKDEIEAEAEAEAALAAAQEKVAEIKALKQSASIKLL